MVYDDRFVADNVLIGHYVAVEQRRNLYGLVIGARGIALKQAVETAELDLRNATATFNTARANLALLIPHGWTIDTFHPLRKDEEIDQRIKDANAELDAAKLAQQNTDLIRTRGQLQTKLLPIIPPNIVTVLEATLDDAALVAEAQIRTHLSQHNRGLGLEWIGQGYKMQIDDGCLALPRFGGQVVNA
jgi:hypothetical protein